MQGEWGDRRQELVFIGEKIEQVRLYLQFEKPREGGKLTRAHSFTRSLTYSQIRPLLTAELDACLLNDAEWKQWTTIMRTGKNDKKGMAKKIDKLEALFDDGFEDW